MTTSTNSTQARELIGVCSECGVSIYEESDVGARSPKIRCSACVAKEESAKMEKHIARTSFFKKSLIIPAIVLALLAIGACVLVLRGDSATKLTDCLICVGAAALIYMPVVQFIWQTEPVATIIEWAFTKPAMNFGLIFELDLDGILWFITVKFLFWILSLVLLVVTAILGIALCVLLSPITFPIALIYAIRNVDLIGW